MHAFNMLPEVATVAADFATYCAFVTARAIFRIFHYVGVKLPLSPSCSKHACLPWKEVSTVWCALYSSSIKKSSIGMSKAFIRSL